MWDYDKLFADGNIVGMKLTNDCIHPMVVDNKGVSNDFKKNYGNDNLYCCGYQVQYIIHLDEHGNVVEKLFDREIDMPKPMPELETGMFVRMADRANWRDNTIAYVDHQNNRLIAKEGWFEALSRKDEWQYLRIVEVFSKNVCCFDQCVDNRVIWRSPEYQAYLDSKSN